MSAILQAIRYEDAFLAAWRHENREATAWEVDPSPPDCVAEPRAPGGPYPCELPKPAAVSGPGDSALAYEILDWLAGDGQDEMNIGEHFAGYPTAVGPERIRIAAEGWAEGRTVRPSFPAADDDTARLVLSLARASEDYEDACRAAERDGRTAFLRKWRESPVIVAAFARHAEYVRLVADTPARIAAEGRRVTGYSTRQEWARAWVLQAADHEIVHARLFHPWIFAELP